MVDFQDPAVIEEDLLAMVKLWHFVNGIFIWEFIITLNYEWSVIRGHRPPRWTIWIYSLTRVCTLITVILNMLAFDSSTPINCQLWIIFELIFSTLTLATASILVVLRIIAIWHGNRIAVAIAICAWNINIAFLIHTSTQLHAAWMPAQSVCVVLNTESTRKNVTATLVTDVVLLLIMLVGLLRMPLHGNMFGLGQILWRQVGSDLALLGHGRGGYPGGVSRLEFKRSPQSHVSNSRTYCVVNGCDTDASLFDRLH